MSTPRLKGVRVALLAADGYERIEVTQPLRALRRQGADVRVISLRPGRIRGVNFLYPGGKLTVDDTVANANPDQYGALLLPGGFVNPDLLRQSEEALAFVRAFDRSGKPIAVICHGPEVLISAGLVAGRSLTSWPGIRHDVQNAGATWTDAEVVRDGNWVSSRGPQDIRAFDAAAIALFAELAPRFLPEAPRRARWAARLFQTAAIGGAAYGAARLLAPRLAGWDMAALTATLPERLVRRARPEPTDRFALIGAVIGMPLAALALSAAAQSLRVRAAQAVPSPLGTEPLPSVEVKPVLPVE